MFLVLNFGYVDRDIYLSNGDVSCVYYLGVFFPRNSIRLPVTGK